MTAPEPVPPAAGHPIDAEIDVTAETCPMTFVRTRLALDRLPPNGLLAVRLRGEEPRRNVSASVAALGHAVTAETLHRDVARLIIRKRG